MAISQDRRINSTGEPAVPEAGGMNPAPGNRTDVNKGDGIAGTAAATARSFYDQAKDTAGKAYEAVTETTASKLDERKSTLSGGLSSVADSVRQVSDNLGSAKTDSGLAEAAAKYSKSAARRIENLADYFERKSVRDMAQDLEGFARRNPAVFIGAAFGVGFLVARFLKSSPSLGNEGYQRQLTGRTEFDEASTTTSGGARRRNIDSTPDSVSNPM